MEELKFLLHPLEVMAEVTPLPQLEDTVNKPVDMEVVVQHLAPSLEDMAEVPWLQLTQLEDMVVLRQPLRLLDMEVATQLHLPLPEDMVVVTPLQLLPPQDMVVATPLPQSEDMAVDIPRPFLQLQHTAEAMLPPHPRPQVTVLAKALQEEATAVKNVQESSICHHRW